MNKFIIEQLKNARGIVVKDLSGNKLEDISDIYSLIIERQINKKDTAGIDETYNFEFMSSVIGNRASAGIRLPLLKMQGKIMSIEGNRLYIKVEGVPTKTNICFHCLRFGNYESICDSCKVEVSETTSWEGWIRKDHIKTIVRVE